MAGRSEQFDGLTMVQRFCKICNHWHDLSEPWPMACIRVEPNKGSSSRINIISDTMDPVQGQHDGKMYDSKAKLRASYRAHGLVEVGNDPARFRRPSPKIDRAQIRASLERAKSRFALTS